MCAIRFTARGTACGKPVRQGGDSCQLRQTRAAALFAGRSDHALPVSAALFSTFGIQPHFGALGDQRHEAGGAQFGCLLQHEIHLLAACHGLRQHQPQR